VPVRPISTLLRNEAACRQMADQCLVDRGADEVELINVLG
jgi:hypothetical protein